MKIRKILSIILVITLTCCVGVNAAAVTNLSEFDEQEQAAYDYYRNCDSITGNILERYDNILNGQNNIDYYALATSMSEYKNDRIAAMNFIITIYEDVTDDERTHLKSYIQSYAPYSDNDDLLSFCDELKTSVPITRATYYSSEAVNYAKANWNKRNSNYPDVSSLGGDCTNFVSQCLLAGGKSMSGDWYIYKKNGNYPKPTTTAELDASWRVADPSPWISAKEFNNYWSDNATETFQCSVADYKSNSSSMYYETIYTGDVVQTLKKTLWWYEATHTMIIVGYDVDNRDFIYAQHSTDAVDRTILGNVCTNSTYKNYYLKFFSI